MQYKFESTSSAEHKSLKPIVWRCHCIQIFIFFNVFSDHLFGLIAHLVFQNVLLFPLYTTTPGGAFRVLPSCSLNHRQKLCNKVQAVKKSRSGFTCSLPLIHHSCSFFGILDYTFHSFNIVCISHASLIFPKAFIGFWRHLIWRQQQITRNAVISFQMCVLCRQGSTFTTIKQSSVSLLRSRRELHVL